MNSSRNSGVVRDTDAVKVTPYQRRALTGETEIGVSRSPQSPRMHFDEVFAHEIAMLRERASAEGYEAGHAKGMATASAAVADMVASAEARVVSNNAMWEDRMASAANALAAAVERLDAQRAPMAEELTAVVSGAAFSLLSDLMGRELAVVQEPGQDAVRRALSLCPADAPVVIRLHPEDHAALTPEWVAALPSTVTVRPDVSVERCGAVAEAGPRRIDAQFSTALARVREVLGA